MSPMEIEQRAQRKAKLQVRAHLSVPDMGNSPARLLLNEDAFVSMLYLERRRAERADKRFVLILIDVKKTLAVVHKDRTMLALTNALSEATRETDIIGWYLENNLLGVIGTELGKATNQVVQERFLNKLRTIFESALGAGKELVHLRFLPFLSRGIRTRRHRPLGEHRAVPRISKERKHEEGSASDQTVHRRRGQWGSACLSFPSVRSDRFGH